MPDTVVNRVDLEFLLAEVFPKYIYTYIMYIFEKSVRLEEKARALVISMQMHNWSFRTFIL